MKKLKTVLIALMVVFILAGLYLATNREKEFSRTEFLLDTTCSLTFYGDDGKEATDAVFEEIERIEDLMSMYNETSDVYRINSAKAGEEISVFPDTYEVLQTAQKIAKESDGAFDITVAPLTALWNFTAENPTVPTEEEIKECLNFVGYENIILKDGKVIKKKAETQIDLGGIAKGYAGDKAKEVAEKFNLTGGIIDLGGNIICFGENPKSEYKIWRVGIQIPFSPTGTYEKTIDIKKGAVVTSGNYQRYFEKDGEIYHHIIHPKTGYPHKADYDSVTVAMESSLIADCLATAVFVTGDEELLEKYQGEVYFEKAFKE